MRRLKTFITAAACTAALVFASAFGAPARAVDITMYYPVAVGGPLTKIVDGMVADFEKDHPDIKVHAIYAGNYNDARVKALAALKSGQPAETSVMFSIDLYELTEQGAIEPFDSLVKTKADRAWLKSFYPSLMANGELAGKTWSIPFQRSTIVMYYNKDAFKEAGLDPNHPPATWAEMRDMAKKLVKKNASGDVERWGVEIPSTGYPYWMFQALAIENGQELMSADGKKVYFDSPASVQALQYWHDLAAKDGVMPKGTVEWGTLRQAFLDGKTAIMWHSTGNLTSVKNAAKFNFGVAMLPAEKRRGSPTGGGNFYIFKAAKPEAKAAALTFIKWMTAPERTAEWSIKTGYMGTRPDAYETPALKKYVAEFPPAAVARDQLKYSVAELSTYDTGRVRKLLDDAIQAALTGKTTPEAALHDAQTRAEQLLKRYY
jgi:sn-glycerol 3-phosphate transport system substrate-binding protein